MADKRYPGQRPPDWKPPERAANSGGGFKAWHAVLIGLVAVILVSQAQDSNQVASTTAEPAPAPALQVDAWASEVLRLGEGCRAGLFLLSNDLSGFGEGTVAAVDAYDRANGLQQVCQQAWLGVRELDLPEGLSGDGLTAANAAQEDCQLWYFNIVQASEGVQEVLDGGGRVSAVSAVRQNIASANAAREQCAAGLRNLGKIEGVKGDLAQGIGEPG